MEEAMETMTHEEVNTADEVVPLQTKPVLVSSCTLEDLFSGNIPLEEPGSNIKGKLAIPEYQRPYVWGEKEVIQLLNDLQEDISDQTEGKPLYYLGSIILHKQSNKLNIIDGQQRLTTLAILQSYLDAAIAPYIEYVSPVSIQNIKRNYALIRSVAAESKSINKLDLSKINITLIITHNEDDAYTFFETQNTGGVRLSGVNIVKAHHLKALESERYRGHYATIWENQKAVDTVVGHLLKARYWGFLNWKEAPSHRNPGGTKANIVKEFSEKTLEKESNKAYQMIALDSLNGNNFLFQPYRFSIRQPLANGKNFIEYLECFCQIYECLFLLNEHQDIDDRFYSFRNKIINKIDGTTYLKELFEVAMLCYVHRFGFDKILEATYWIFRHTYALRVLNEKTVKENSIPAFLQGNNNRMSHILDHILSSFNHQQLIGRLRSFKYDVDTTDIDKNTVKTRFIDRVKDHFDFESISGYDATTYRENYDNLLQKAIDVRTSKSI